MPRRKPVDLAERYLDLLKKTLTHTAYGRTDVGGYPPRNPVKRLVLAALAERQIVPVRVVPTEGSPRIDGRDWPLFAQTMVGRRRLDNLHACVEDVLAQQVPGDLIETGVWRGGAAILMRGVLAAHGVHDRKVYVADSFAGLPPPDPARYPADAGSIFHTAASLSVPLEEVERNFRTYGLLDDQVVFVKGWFRDTLPRLHDRTWAVIRLDGDMYESTFDALVYLEPRLSPGGYVIVDDYSIDACRAAVTDFRAQHGIADTIHEVDWSGVYWRKASRG